MDFGDANPIRTPESPKARHGLWASEVCDLRWDQVDFNGAVLHVRRVNNGTPSTHPIRGDEMRALRRLRPARTPDRRRLTLPSQANSGLGIVLATDAIWRGLTDPYVLSFPKVISGLRKPIAIQDCDQLQHKLAGVTTIGSASHRQARRRRAAHLVMTRISSGGAPVGKRFRNIDNQCPFGEIEEHRRITALGNDPSGGGIGLSTGAPEGISNL